MSSVSQGISVTSLALWKFSAVSAENPTPGGALTLPAKALKRTYITDSMQTGQRPKICGAGVARPRELIAGTLAAVCRWFPAAVKRRCLVARG
ncbi:hypothetical protein IMCC21224_112864 [Puniceibacterium sp. IMCC21224]|nr:hypothetical protein IMCC21224_112864 [Puniceibacterium sp. IMCC21224]